MIQIKKYKDELYMAYRDKYSYYLIGICLLIIKLYILNDIPIWGRPGSLRDDLLMVNMANNLLSGNWLGEYSEFTFIKGITYPIFLAFCYKFYIPSNIANTIFYAMAVILFIKAIQPVIKSKISLLVLYFIMLFQPISYATNTFQRIYRDDIYYSLILMLVSCLIGIWLDKGARANKKWLLLGTVVLIAILFCREDSIWIIPIFFVVISKVYMYKKDIFIIVYPLLGILGTYLVFGGINYYVYGSFIINEMQYSSFTKAYGMLTKIDPEKKYSSKIKVSNEALEKAYLVSPTLYELKPIYEGNVGDMWRAASYEWNRAEGIPKSEIAASHSMWAFRNAVAQLGYYESPQKADEFYNNVIKELDEGFKTGKIERKSGMNIPLFSTPSLNDIELLPLTFLSTLQYVIDEKDLYCKLNLEVPDNRTRDIGLFELITRQNAIGDNSNVVSGWILFKNNRNKELSLMDENTEDIKIVERVDSDDVFNYFANRGNIYEDAKKARFTLRMPYTTSLEDVSLRVKEKGKENELVKLPVNKVMRVERNDFVYCIDSVQFPQNSYNNQSKLEYISMFSKIYALINKICICLSIILFIPVLYLYKHENNTLNDLFSVLILLWIVFLCRIFVIAYNTVTAFYSVGYAYLSPCYPIMEGIIVITFMLMIESIGGKINEHKSI